MALEGDRSAGGKAVAFLRQWWRAAVAEAVGTALLVLLGVASTLLPVHPPLEQVAIGFGCMVLALVQILGPVSGAHMNPAVTLAALLHGEVSAAPAALYVVAQSVGSLVGFGALVAMTPGHYADAPAGCNKPENGTTPLAAAFMEALLTGVLCLTACAIWSQHDPARPDTTVPLKFGLVVAGLVCAGGGLSSASLNPARSFGPAVIQNAWNHHWVYWVGPLTGAAAAALLHRLVLSPPAPPAPAHAHTEALPLREKHTDVGEC